jgi:predicted nuclease of predicted toxin-antitoxin system
MWLLDANMDVHLLTLLQQFGQEAEATTRRGWKNLTNGELVSAAVGAGFTCIITQDRLFGETAARALKTYPQFAVVVVHLPQKPWQQYRNDFQAAWSKTPIRPVQGQIVHWPSAN